MADVAAAIQVVQAEDLVELLLQLAAGGDAQHDDDELLGVDGAIATGVKGAGDVLRELGGAAIG